MRHSNSNCMGSTRQKLFCTTDLYSQRLTLKIRYKRRFLKFGNRMDLRKFATALGTVVFTNTLMLNFDLKPASARKPLRYVTKWWNNKQQSLDGWNNAGSKFHHHWEGIGSKLLEQPQVFKLCTTRGQQGTYILGQLKKQHFGSWN